MDRGRLARIAYLYYKEKLSQNEIAKLVDVSRSQVSRLLTEAEKCGVVRIEIDGVAERAYELEEKLKNTFGLVGARVVYRLGTEEAALRKTAGRAAAQYVTEVLTDSDLVGLTSGHTLGELVRFTKKPDIEHLRVIQLMGGAGATFLQTYPEALARDYAEALGATLLSLHAPLLVENQQVRDVIMSTDSVAEVVRQWDSVDVVVMGVGSLTPNAFLLKAKWFSEEDLRAVIGAGAVAVACGQFFDSLGRRVHSPTDERLIAIQLDQLRRARCSIAVAAGEDKVIPLLAAIRGKYCNTVVTDDKTAEKILKAAK